MAEIDAKKALSENTGPQRARAPLPGVDPRAARGLLREQRRQVPLDIEANVDGVTYTGAGQNVYNGPTVMAGVVRRGRQQARSGCPVSRTPTRTSPRTTTSTTTQIFRIGNKGDTTCRGRVDQGRRPTTATSTRSPPRNGSRRTRRRTRRPSSPASSRATPTRLTRTPRSARSRPSSPTYASVEDLPEKTWGYQRPAATMLGYGGTRRGLGARTRRRRTSASTTTACPSGGGDPLPEQQPSYGRRHLEGHGPSGRQLAHRPPRRPDRPGTRRSPSPSRATRCAREPRAERRRARSRARRTR